VSLHCHLRTSNNSGRYFTEQTLHVDVQQRELEQALGKAASVADRQKAMCLTAVNFILFRGRPMADYAAYGGLLEFTKHPAFAAKHWTDWSGWIMAEANDRVLVKHMKAAFTAAPFFSMSCDETTDVSKVSRLSIHAYVINSAWERKSHLIRLCQTDLPATGETLALQLYTELSTFSGLEEYELARRFVGIGTDGAAVLQGCHKGVQTRFQTKFPFMVGFHCMAHRVDLAAKAISKSTLASDTIKACTKSTAEYAHGGNRLLRMEQCRDELGLKKLTLKTVAATRWMSHRAVIDRVYDLLPALLLSTYDDPESYVTLRLTNVRIQLAMVAMLPMLDTLDGLVVQLQTDGAYIGDLVSEVESAISELHTQYLGRRRTAWSGSLFERWHALLECGKDDSCSRWVLSEGPDINGDEYDESVVCFRFKYKDSDKEQVMPLLSKLVSVDGKRAAVRPTVVNAEQLELIADEVRAEVTNAVQALIQDLQDRFPETETLRAFSLLSPVYWQGADHCTDLSQEYIECLIERFGTDKTAECGNVSALIDANMLRNQASFFMAHAARVASRMKGEEGQKIVEGESVAARRDKFVKMWQIMTQSDQSVAQLSEFIKLGKLALTVVGTSVNDERAFSAMSFVKKPERNALDKHLEVAVRAKYQGQFDYRNFPIEEGLKEWHDGAEVRGRYKAK
jgi:hypothetical protein